MKIRLINLVSYLAIISICCYSLLSCTSNHAKDGRSKLLIVTTTGMIQDAVKNIVGEKADVIALMGPGIDPHLYKPKQSDLTKLTDADIVFFNGLHLEGKMTEIFEKISRTKPVIAIADTLDQTKLRSDPIFGNAVDPHIWFDVKKWSDCVAFISTTMKKADPDNAEFYEENAKAYLTKLDQLDREATAELASIPQEHRVLITTHDAFGYFGEAYNLEVKGLQGFSTVADIGLKDITEMVDLIIKRKVKAIFVESSVSDKALKSVIEGCNEKGHEVKLGGILYADAMGAEGTEEGTYIGMFKANVHLIVKALK